MRRRHPRHKCAHVGHGTKPYLLGEKQGKRTAEATRAVSGLRANLVTHILSFGTAAEKGDSDGLTHRSWEQLVGRRSLR